MYDMTKQYGLGIVVNDDLIHEYPHGNGYVFVEGRKGTEYELELRNDSSERILMIPSVDGLSIMDGKEAGLDSQGYIINPHSQIRVPGWKLDNNNVAKFIFDDAKRSYTKRSGEGSANVGAIGALVFREKQQAFLLRSYSYSSMGNDYGNSSDGGIMIGASALNCNEQIGTGFGESTNFKTNEVNFEKRDSDNPDAVLSLFYDSAKGLEKRGIVLAHRQDSQPTPFPRYMPSLSNTYNSTSCTPPLGWSPDARDTKLQHLIDQLNTKSDRDTMTTMLSMVDTEKLEDAFSQYKPLLKNMK